MVYLRLFFRKFTWSILSIFFKMLMIFISYSSLICIFFDWLMTLMSSWSVVKQNSIEHKMKFLIARESVARSFEICVLRIAKCQVFLENELHIYFLALNFFLLVYLLISCLLPIPPLLIMELVRGIGKRKYPEKHYQDFFRKKGELQQQVFKLNLTNLFFVWILCHSFYSFHCFLGSLLITELVIRRMPSRALAESLANWFLYPQDWL